MKFESGTMLDPRPKFNPIWILTFLRNQVYLPLTISTKESLEGRMQGSSQLSMPPEIHAMEV